jgi:hypothetical protein
MHHHPFRWSLEDSVLPAHRRGSEELSRRTLWLTSSPGSGSGGASEALPDVTPIERRMKAIEVPGFTLSGTSEESPMTLRRLRRLL